ncbi:MAG: cyclodeaminase/cyclohydrolase family protein [Clostridiales Family XIII bacterium]|jgi:formiminotetrahydrofolate cyclodeaminase|nr:cyclodeaminase/cyclohydrolase family protein [Clostridiales Family XIII bacterium]
MGIFDRFKKADVAPGVDGATGYAGDVKNKTPFAARSVEMFVTDLSSKASVPGGGGAAALAGALAAALGSMAANLSMKPSEQDSEMQVMKTYLYRIQTELVALIDKDAEAFAPLAGAWRLPERNDSEKENKERVVQACLKQAADVPMETLRKSCEAAVLLKALSEKGGVRAQSDVVCGAILCRAALEAAWVNVRANTALMADEAYARRLEEDAQALLRKYLPTMDAVAGA